MNGGDANRLEEVAVIPARHQAERDRDVGRAEGRHADRTHGLPELRRDDGRLIDAGGLALVAAGADRREPLDVFDRAHTGTQGPAHVRHGDVPLQVDEMGRPFRPITRDHPVRHDRSLAAPGQVSGRRPDDVDIWCRAIRYEAGQTLVVSKPALRLAVEMQRRVEAP